MTDQVPRALTAAHWQRLVNRTFEISEREELMRQALHDERNADRVRQIYDEWRQVGERLQRQTAAPVCSFQNLDERRRRFLRGEMVYGHTFNELYALPPTDFRRLVAARYSARLAQRALLDAESVAPEIRIDCRFLPSLSHVWLQKVFA